MTHFSSSLKFWKESMIDLGWVRCPFLLSENIFQPVGWGHRPDMVSWAHPKGRQARLKDAVNWHVLQRHLSHLPHQEHHSALPWPVSILQPFQDEQIWTSLLTFNRHSDSRNSIADSFEQVFFILPSPSLSNNSHVGKTKQNCICYHRILFYLSKNYPLPDCQSTVIWWFCFPPSSTPSSFSYRSNTGMT